MSKDKFDILEKLYKDKLQKRFQKGKEYKKECEESERYIREMQEMELKRELRYNTAITAVIGFFLVLCIVLVGNSISHIKRASKAKVSVEQKQEQLANKPATKEETKIKTDKKETDKKEINKKETEKPKVQEVKPEESTYYEKIGSSLDTEDLRKKILKDALSLNSGKYEGINIKYMVAILRANGVNVPASISRTDSLVKELEKLGWKKGTNPKDLKKGDIVFTIDTVGISGVPSHTYIFMAWENAKNENGFIVDGLSAKENVTYHKRPITVQSENTDKFQFFMRK